MRKNFLQFSAVAVKDFFEATVNVFVFLPYFFSVITLFKTLFSPWKNLVATKSPRAFSFQNLFEKLSFNLISSGIGFVCRFSVISFYLIIQISYIVLLPFLFVVYILFLPLFYFFYLFEKTDDEKKKIAKSKFIANHLLEKNNYAVVERWFEDYYKEYNHNSQWWKINNLLSYPPLARDWAVGYTPLVDEYCEELTSPSYQAMIKTAYDREKEIEQIERILSKSSQANVIIIGDEGVGKHTVVDAMSKKIYEGKINPLLSYKRILKLNMEKVLNQNLDQKQRENFFESILQEACLAKNVILLIENFDRYVCGGGERIDLTVPIEKYAKGDRIQIIAISEPFLYQKFIYSNEKINRIFEKVDVYEIKKEDAEKVLLSKCFIFEKRYRVPIPYETIKAIIEKSDFFITDIPFPEKAIALLDLVCVQTQKNKISFPTPQIVDQVLTEKTHIPTNLTDQIRSKLINLESLLYARIVQQHEAIIKLAGAIRRSFLMIGKRKKPIGSFLFLGPTGVGKTQTAKSLAEIFFGSEKYLIRFDMSNYQSKGDVLNLIGSIESNNPGLLTSAIRENPFGVLLLDELEKADRSLINIFLTILDEGYFTDGHGDRVDCKNLIIIATSNAQGEINQLIDQKIFSPEFLNRFDGIISFKTLNEESISDLATKYITKISDDIFKLYGVRINVSPEYLKRIISKGFDPRFGARNLERAIREEIEDRVAKVIIEKKVKEGETISL